MRHTQRALLVLRGTAVCTVGCLAETALATASRDAWARLGSLPRRPEADLATVLTDIATVAALAAWTWLLVVAVLAVAAALPRVGQSRPEAVIRHLAPVAARRALLGLLGVSALMAPGLAMAAARLDSPQSVASAGVRWGELHSRAPGSQLHGLPLPDRPVGRPPPGHRRDAGGPEVVVVAPGDTLWDIAAHWLGPHAPTSAISGAWPAWYAANRSAIGPDPDLILPGTVLRPPPRSALSPPPDERP